MGSISERAASRAAQRRALAVLLAKMVHGRLFVPPVDVKIAWPFNAVCLAPQVLFRDAVFATLPALFVVVKIVLPCTQRHCIYGEWALENKPHRDNKNISVARYTAGHQRETWLCKPNRGRPARCCWG